MLRIRGHFDGRAVVLEERSRELRPNTPVDILFLDAPRRDADTESSEKPAGGGLRIVIAEDDVANRDFLCIVLGQMGHHIAATAASGPAFVSRVRELSPDLVLFEMRLPGINGLEAMRQIWTAQSVAAVAMTTDPDANLIRKALSANVLTILPKPLTHASILAGVEGAWANVSQLKLLREENSELRVQLHNRKVIERAKGVLMKRYQFSEAEAFRVLQQKAMAERVTIVQIAQRILDGKLGDDLLDQKFERRGRAQQRHVTSRKSVY